MPHRLKPALIAGALLAAAACTRERPIEQTPAPQITLYGVRMQYFREDELTASGYAKVVTYQRRAGELAASEASVRLPRLGGAPAPGRQGAEIEAGLLEGSAGTRKARGTRGVVVRTRSGLVGRTDRAQIDGETLEATGDAPAHVEAPGLELDGNNFHFRFREEEFEFGGGVSSRLGGGS